MEIQHIFSSNMNHTVTEFVILGFSNLGSIHQLLFGFLACVYVLIIFGNITIAFVTWFDPHLHTPMYTFTGMLSLLDIFYTAVTVPQILVIFWAGRAYISFMGCLFQMYFFHSLGITENYLLTVMAYDRYVAICNPLRYATIMTFKYCKKLMSGCFLCGFLSPVTKLILVSRLPFCGSNNIHHLFCDLSPLLHLACTDTYLNVIADFIINSCIIVLTSIFITLTYIHIIIKILKMNTAEGRKKAFSTCTAHLAVVFIFFGSVAFMYVRPRERYTPEYDQLVAINYTVLTPLLNPLVYSLRNKEIKKSLKKIFHIKGYAEKKIVPSGVP
ncbi:olfactory receptor 6N2-like [Spea bombifrons]|uniref:olfactory receptor 6N2-like n=1 Tax=Spea bombifrons TaxID=233779 RepID=UPI00234A29E8|nr:olfactory receptor 6N2-like [Spea bombifrons]